MAGPWWLGGVRAIGPELGAGHQKYGELEAESALQAAWPRSTPLPAMSLFSSCWSACPCAPVRAAWAGASVCGQGLAQNTLDASPKSFTHSLILPGHTEHACPEAGVQELLPGGLRPPARGSCSWGCRLGAESGPEVPAGVWVVMEPHGC